MAFFRKAGSMLARFTTTNINQEILSSKTSVFQMIRCMSTSKIFVGGLSYNIDDRSLRETFDKYGTIDEARVLVDRETGRSRGFGFVTYTSVEEASDAIQAMDQQELEGRILKVNFANERTRGFSGGSRGGNFGDGGSSNGGGFIGGYGGGGGYNNDAYPGNAGGGVYGGGSNLNSGVDGNTNSGDYRGSNSYGNQSFGIAGGAVGFNNLFSGGMDASVDAAAPGNERFVDKFSSEETNHVESASKF